MNNYRVTNIGNPLFLSDGVYKYLDDLGWISVPYDKKANTM